MGYIFNTVACTPINWMFHSYRVGCGLTHLPTTLFSILFKGGRRKFSLGSSMLKKEKENRHYVKFAYTLMPLDYICISHCINFILSIIKLIFVLGGWTYGKQEQCRSGIFQSNNSSFIYLARSSITITEPTIFIERFWQTTD